EKMFILRNAEPADVPHILRLIKVPLICLYAGYRVVGFAMYYFTYDPWIGKLLYLEDFYVMKEFRGYGIGSEILKRLSEMAVKCRCSSMHFIVAEWNKTSIEFYKRRGAADLSHEEGWRLFEIGKQSLLKMSK
uniref:Diamine acetyltransferase 1 n=1 Tax=Astyanax mexicanus TaxID=7994 RepID=A0A3B1J836_ASTMX